MSSGDFSSAPFTVPRASADPRLPAALGKLGDGPSLGNGSLCDVRSEAAASASKGERGPAGGLAVAAAPAAPPPPGSSSLVTDGQSSARDGEAKRKGHRGGTWTRQQRRIYRGLRSWLLECDGRGCHFLRVDLTGAPNSDAHRLARDHQELRRRVERVFGFKGLEYYAIQTREGNGVLHMIWAWAGTRSFYIPKRWLDSTWAEIHGGSFITWIAPMGRSVKDQHNVTRYFTVQYLADQDALVRQSYSWHRSKVALTKAWESLKRLASVTFYDDSRKYHWRREYIMPISEMIAAWQSLLTSGGAMLGDVLLVVRGRDVVEVF